MSWRRALAAAGSVWLAVPGHGEPARAAPAALYMRSLAAGCAACHGTDGHAPADAALPALAGMAAPVLIERMQAYRSGARPGTVMPQIAKGYSDAQIAELADYFALQGRP